MSSTGSTNTYDSLTLSLGYIETAVSDQLLASEGYVEDALSDATYDGELTTGEALELQYELAKWALLYEAASNVGKKIDDSLSNTVANMR